jgi:hypothetical protein
VLQLSILQPRAFLFLVSTCKPLLAGHGGEVKGFSVWVKVRAQARRRDVLLCWYLHAVPGSQQLWPPCSKKKQVWLGTAGSVATCDGGHHGRLAVCARISCRATGRVAWHGGTRHPQGGRTRIVSPASGRGRRSTPRTSKPNDGEKGVMVLQHEHVKLQLLGVLHHGKLTVLHE